MFDIFSGNTSCSDRTYFLLVVAEAIAYSSALGSQDLPEVKTLK